jgi:hypothetical protein
MTLHPNAFRWGTFPFQIRTRLFLLTVAKEEGLPGKGQPLRQDAAGPSGQGGRGQQHGFLFGRCRSPAGQIRSPARLSR